MIEKRQLLIKEVEEEIIGKIKKSKVKVVEEIKKAEIKVLRNNE